MGKVGLLIALLISACMPLPAQSNQVLDQLLDQPEAGFGIVVSLTLAAAGIVPNTATGEEAVQALRKQGWDVAPRPTDAPILLGDYAYLLMRAFHMSGGVLYSLLPGPRYAARELGYLKLIPTDARPLRTVSGEEAVRILGNVMAYAETRQ